MHCCHRYYKTIFAAKHAFYSTLICSSSPYPHPLEYHKQHPSQKCRMLSTYPLPLNVLNIFCWSNIKTHLNLQSNPYSTLTHFLPSTPPPALHHVTPAFLLEISDFLFQSHNSHCNPDPIPTTVLKKIANEIAPTILSIVNIHSLNFFNFITDLFTAWPVAFYGLSYLLSPCDYHIFLMP